MGEAYPPTTFSLAKDGKHHDATFSVEGGVVSVIYWAPHGVIRRTARAISSLGAEQTARMLLHEMI
jgi:hypothetical protein